jgi:hypothetical protein
MKGKDFVDRVRIQLGADSDAAPRIASAWSRCG